VIHPTRRLPHWKPRPLLVGLLMLSACAAPRPSDDASGVVTLQQLGENPADFRDRTILVRGWFVSKGEGPEGVWLAVAVSPDAMRQVRAGGGVIGLPDGLTFLLPPGSTSGIVDDADGKELEMLIRVVDQVTLWNGRPAVRVIPLQLSIVRRFDAG